MQMNQKMINMENVQHIKGKEKNVMDAGIVLMVAYVQSASLLFHHLLSFQLITCLLMVRLVVIYFLILSK